AAPSASANGDAWREPSRRTPACCCPRAAANGAPRGGPGARGPGPRPSESVLIRVRQKREVPCALDRRGELPLIRRARAGDPARYDLARLGNVRLQCREILVVDLLDAFGRKTAKLLAAEIPCHSCSLLNRAGPQAV